MNGSRGLGIGFWVSAVWLVIISLSALFAPVLPLTDPTEVGVGDPREAPMTGLSDGIVFGTDALGRDVLSRTVHGARISLTVGAFSVVFGICVGGGVGMIAGYSRGWFDQLTSAVFLVMLSFPPLVLAVLVTATLERSFLVVALTLGVLAVAPAGRLARASALVCAQRDFMTAARVIGARHRRIIVRELLPNVLAPMGVLALLGVAVIIVAEGVLAFLGLSVEGDTNISWGRMIVDGSGIRDLQKAPHVVILPITAMFATVLSLNYLGTRIREHFDVRELVF